MIHSQRDVWTRLQSLCESFPLSNWKQLQKIFHVSPFIFTMSSDSMHLYTKFIFAYQKEIPGMLVPMMYQPLARGSKCVTKHKKTHTFVNKFIIFWHSTLKDFCLRIGSLCMMSTKGFSWLVKNACFNTSAYLRSSNESVKYCKMLQPCQYHLYPSFDVSLFKLVILSLLNISVLQMAAALTNQACVSGPIPEWRPINPWSSRLPIIHRHKTKHLCACSL